MEYLSNFKRSKLTFFLRKTEERRSEDVDEYRNVKFAMMDSNDINSLIRNGNELINMGQCDIQHPQRIGTLRRKRI